MLKGTTIAASISQSDFVLLSDDLALNEELEIAWADARQRLHPENTFEVGKPSPPPSPQPADRALVSDVTQQLRPAQILWSGCAHHEGGKWEWLKRWDRRGDRGA